ncbi:hypothetical protein [Leifsonia sp. P73]|uniref:hypothetical protein n=1 Tax=Leifsonia sp. P73 TaxID=3423959 RepID=UPI003DA2E17A
MHSDPTPGLQTRAQARAGEKSPGAPIARHGRLKPRTLRSSLGALVLRSVAVVAASAAVLAGLAVFDVFATVNAKEGYSSSTPQARPCRRGSERSTGRSTSSWPAATAAAGTRRTTSATPPSTT